MTVSVRILFGYAVKCGGNITYLQKLVRKTCWLFDSCWGYHEDSCRVEDLEGRTFVWNTCTFVQSDSTELSSSSDWVLTWFCQREETVSLFRQSLDAAAHDRTDLSIVLMILLLFCSVLFLKMEVHELKYTAPVTITLVTKVPYTHGSATYEYCHSRWKYKVTCDLSCRTSWRTTSNKSNLRLVSRTSFLDEIQFWQRHCCSILTSVT